MFRRSSNEAPHSRHDVPGALHNSGKAEAALPAARGGNNGVVAPIPAIAGTRPGLQPSPHLRGLGQQSSNLGVVRGGGAAASKASQPDSKATSVVTPAVGGDDNKDSKNNKDGMTQKAIIIKSALN